jgi:hypothetical protein
MAPVSIWTIRKLPKNGSTWSFHMRSDRRYRSRRRSNKKNSSDFHPIFPTTVRETTDSETAQRLIADELPSVVTRVLEPAELEAVHQRLKQLSEPPKHAHLSKDDSAI